MASKIQFRSAYCKKTWSRRGIWGSFFLLLSSRHRKVIKWQFILFKMTKFSLKWWWFHLNFFFEQKKLPFDDFLMTTWEQENESKRKKKPQIPRLIEVLFLCNSHQMRSWQNALMGTANIFCPMHMHSCCFDVWHGCTLCTLFLAGLFPEN